MKNIDFVTVIFVGFLLFAFAIYYVVARAAHYPAHTLTDEQINPQIRRDSLYKT